MILFFFFFLLIKKKNLGKHEEKNVDLSDIFFINNG